MNITLLLSGLALISVAVLMLVLGILARKKRLPLNQVTGIRTKATMRSEEIWIKVHYTYAWLFYVSALDFLLAGIWFLVQVVTPVFHTMTISVFLSIVGTMLVILIIGGIRADKYARSLSKSL